MIKNVMKRVWAFDIEWVPDPVAGRILYELPEDTDATDTDSEGLSDTEGAT